MIGMGKSISHTGASMGYGLSEEKNPVIVCSQHVAGETPKEITQEFKIIQQQNHLCRKNTLSFVLSPTIKDGKELTNEGLNEITERFVREMKLQENQAIAFVHRNKAHVHIHLYVNRINFQGKAYKDSFIGKRSQQVAERVAKQMGLTTVREVQQQKLDKVKDIRAEIKRLHEKVINEMRPKDFDQYIKYMEQKDVEVLPSINKQNRLQGFRFAYNGENLKGSEVHRSMSMGRIAERIGFDKSATKKIAKYNTLKVLGKTVGITPNLAANIAKKAIKLAVKKSIGLGMQI
ncbi:relaxase/mobilization nuclease domain-containing protein [Kriegella aquimaris]|uniref:Relaxase/Mobilisation nuclease domain-containing protein n=1 Tax=Kriegella aquimaris TaxID=192904 RepID=A0A1G9VJX9_9FLAO|nr:relaxase/mobilization nuclease domain-containing protein [Kriegella aquimaris]SDM72125.1 Relaxase/Mobilisation nuclease domain-containing protein [Kriegella aquimaris]